MHLALLDCYRRCSIGLAADRPGRPTPLAGGRPPPTVRRLWSETGSVCVALFPADATSKRRQRSPTWECPAS